jgi:plastocyanin
MGLLLLSCSRSAPVPAPQPQTHTIVIESMRFEPADLTIHPGDTIVWMNKDLFAHTATAEGAFDSRQIDPGGSWRVTLRTPGDVPYICALHPTMKAFVRVRDRG